MDYRAYTIGWDGAEYTVAIPERNVASFDAYISESNAGETIEAVLNRFEAILV